MSGDGQIEQCIHEYFSSIGVIFFGDNIMADICIFFEKTAFVEKVNFVSSQHSFLRDCLSDQRQR